MKLDDGTELLLTLATPLPLLLLAELLEGIGLAAKRAGYGDVGLRNDDGALRIVARRTQLSPIDQDGRS